MIRTLQNAGPTVKIILGGLLVLICASMAITLIPGFGSNVGIGLETAVGASKPTWRARDEPARDTREGTGQKVGWYPVCGTSEATPLFSGIVALADQAVGGVTDPLMRAVTDDPLELTAGHLDFRTCEHAQHVPVQCGGDGLQRPAEVHDGTISPMASILDVLQ